MGSNTNLSVASVASSDVFLFIVGPEQQEVVIHTAALQVQSSYFQALVNGPFREATDGYAIWPDVEPEVALAFWRYVYQNDYQDSFAIDPRRQRVAATGRNPGVDRFCPVTSHSPATSSSRYRQNVPTQQLDWKAYNNRRYPPLTGVETKMIGSKKLLNRLDDICKSRRWAMSSYCSNTGLCQGQKPYTLESDIILHAKVWAFADRFLIWPLLKLAAKNLHATVLACKETLSVSDDILSLLEFCFTGDIPFSLYKFAEDIARHCYQLFKYDAAFIEVISLHPTIKIELDRERALLVDDDMDDYESEQESLDLDLDIDTY